MPTFTTVKQRFRFQVKIPGTPVVTAKFRNASELSMELGKAELYHGGSPLPFKMPGRVTVTDLTLEHGATSEGSLFTWFGQTAIAATAAGAGFQFKRTLDLIEFDRDGVTQLNRWRLHNAFPVKFMAGEWDNDSDEFTISGVTLTFDYFTPTLLQQALKNREFAQIAAQL